MDSFEIFFSDLNEDAQKRLLQAVGYSDPKEGNWDMDLCPLVIYEFEPQFEHLRVKEISPEQVVFEVKILDGVEEIKTSFSEIVADMYYLKDCKERILGADPIKWSALDRLPLMGCAVQVNDEGSSEHGYYARLMSKKMDCSIFVFKDGHEEYVYDPQILNRDSIAEYLVEGPSFKEFVRALNSLKPGASI